MKVAISVYVGQKQVSSTIAEVDPRLLKDRLDNAEYREGRHVYHRTVVVKIFGSFSEPSHRANDGYWVHSWSFPEGALYSKHLGNAQINSAKKVAARLLGPSYQKLRKRRLPAPKCEGARIRGGYGYIF